MKNEKGREKRRKKKKKFLKKRKKNVINKMRDKNKLAG